jgi:hypothetical protein
LSASAESGLRAFLARLVLDLCPRAVADLQERVASMRFPRPPAGDVAAYMAGRIAAGLFAEHLGLDLPAALLPGFITLADELDRSVQTGAVERWLAADPANAFGVDFVRHLIGFIDDCLGAYRKDAA